MCTLLRVGVGLHDQTVNVEVHSVIGLDGALHDQRVDVEVHSVKG